MKFKICYFIVLFLAIGGFLINAFNENFFVRSYAVQSTVFPNYIEISNAKQLCEIADEVNLNKNFILKNDIDLNLDTSWHDYVADSENGWMPIDAINNFGIFDGNGYEIKNLYINRSDLDKAGLFSQSNLTIKNLQVEYFDLQPFGLIGGNVVGGLVANNLGIISHCSVKVDIKSSDLAGGLVGINSGNIDNSFFEGYINGEFAGGLIAKCDFGNINNCYAFGTIYAKTVGGFIGESILTAKISNSFSFVDIFDNEQESAGSFIGMLGENVSVDNCYTLNLFSKNIPNNLGTFSTGIIPLNNTDFLQREKFDFDFENTWYFDKVIAGYPLIRDVYVTLYLENGSLNSDELLKRNYYYVGENFQISLLNYPDKEFASIIINEKDKTNEIIDKTLQYAATERTQIEIKLEFLLQIRINQKNSNDVVLEQEFYKSGEKVILEIKNRPLSRVKEVHGTFNEEEIAFQKINKNDYEFLINTNIEEGEYLTVYVDYFSYLPIVIGAGIFLIIVIVFIIVFVLVRRRKNHGQKGC